MRMISIEHGTKYMCQTCGYVYDVDECGNIIAGGDKPFMKLIEKQLYVDGYNDIQRVNLYVCPHCMSVQLCQEEVDD